MGRDDLWLAIKLPWPVLSRHSPFAIRLTDWCCPGQFIQAIEELYAESIEPFGVSDLDQIQKGKNAIIVKNK